MSIYRRVLVLGGARSGKSRTALQLAESASTERIYIATAQAFDGEMRERIAQHQAERDGSWRTVDAPLDLPQAVQAQTAPGKAVLVDCLTLGLPTTFWAENNRARKADRWVKVFGMHEVRLSWSRT